MPGFALCRHWACSFACLAWLVLGGSQLAALPKNRQPVPELSQQAAADLLQQLRLLRLSRDVYVEFELESLLRNTPTRRKRGWLAWSWNDRGLVQRLALLPVAGGAQNLPIQEWILHSGIDSQAWTRKNSQPFERIDGIDLLRPLTPHGLFSIFDFLMPYIHWQGFNYTGAGRLKSREVHYIDLLAPPSNPLQRMVPRVRLALDARYAVPLSVKRYDIDGNVQWEQKIESIQKLDGQYVPKQYLIKSISTGDRERFVMRSMKLQGPLDPQLFDPLLPAPMP